MRRSPGCLRLQRLLRKENSRSDAHRCRIRKEIRRKLPFRYVIDHLVYREPLPRVHKIADLGKTPHVAYLGNHPGVVVAEIFQPGGHVVHGALYKRGVEDNRRSSYLLPEAVYASSAAVRPVVYVEERVPPECEIAVGLLAQIRSQVGSAYLPITADLYPVGRQTVLPFRHEPGGAAAGKHEQHQEYGRRPSHLRLNSESVTAVATATFKDSAPPPKDGMRSRQSSRRATSALMPLDSLPMTTRPSGASCAE